MRERLVEATHENCHHIGADKVFAALQMDYWWLGMQQIVVEVVQKCVSC